MDTLQFHQTCPAGKYTIYFDESYWNPNISFVDFQLPGLMKPGIKHDVINDATIHQSKSSTLLSPEIWIFRDAFVSGWTRKCLKAVRRLINQSSSSSFLSCRFKNVRSWPIWRWFMTCHMFFGMNIVSKCPSPEHSSELTNLVCGWETLGSSLP